MLINFVNLCRETKIPDFDLDIALDETSTFLVLQKSIFIVIGM